MSTSASRQFSRRWSTRLVACAAVVMAAAWGPLSQLLRLVEIRDEGKPGSERSFRIVLARDVDFGRSRHTAKDAPKNSSKAPSESKSSTTERVLSAVSDLVESAHAIHFDASSAPVPLETPVWSHDATGRPVASARSLVDARALASGLARAPPLNASAPRA